MITDIRLLSSAEFEAAEQQEQSNIKSSYIQIPNRVSSPLNDKKIIVIPCYLRASLKEIINISIQQEAAMARFDIFITVPYFLENEQEIQMTEIQDPTLFVKQLQTFLKNNLSLEIAGKFIEIAEIQKPARKKTDHMSFTEDVVNEIIEMVIHQQKYDEATDSDEEEEMNQAFFIKRITQKNLKNYSSFLISGVFRCLGNISTQFFPYHQLMAGLEVKVHPLFFKGRVIRYNIMYLQQEQTYNASQFKFSQELTALYRFGVYNLDFTFRQLRAAKKQQDIYISQIHYQDLSLTKALTFYFKVYCSNVPFIMRYEVSLLILCFSSLMLNFAPADNIANFYGNIILISVAEITLLSNFRQSCYSTEKISLYEITLSGLLVISFLQILTETLAYYQQHDLDQVFELSQVHWLYHTEIAIILLLILLNCFSLIYLGLKRKSQLQQSILKIQKIRRSQEWSQDDFQSCTCFEDLVVKINL